VASTAWIILNSKFLNSDEVELNLTSLHHGKENPDSHIVCISRDSELRTIIDQVNSTAYLHGSSKLWHLSLKLPLVYLDGALSRSTQLVIVETENSGWTWKELSIYKSMPDLLLVVNPSDSNINFELFTFTTSISITRSQRLFQQFSHIVNQLECLPTAHVGDLSLVGPKDVADIERWNENPVEPVLDCVHWAIERQARERPEAEAVCAWDGSLNYKEISFASNRLAKRLAAFGVGPEVLVPVCFEKSIWAIVAMVAILKAGGGCVPLNPGHPRSRHQVILDDIKAPVIIASESYRSLAHELHSDVVIVSREAIDALDSEDSEVYLDKVAVGPYNPAFAVFTSGSTGQPKGIVIEHSAICTSIYNHGRVMRFGSQTRTIQFAAYTFDDSFSDIFTTLTFGGCICVPSERDRLNDLAGSIVRMNANHACLTVTVASQLRPSDVPTLDTLIVGGESVTAKVVQQWAEHVYLINSYGPAEASIFCSANSDLSSTDDPINIGVGVGCLLHITDTEDHNSLLPIGAVGELLIEGPILARCYIRNDDKTNASFITNPAWVSIVDGAPRRFYKTGDLARYQENGTIQVLGRKDTQVKVHGQRIELGEIEHHLRNEIMNCKEAAVDVLRPTTASEPAPSVLVAFLQIADSKESHSGISEQKPLEVMHEFPDLVEERLKQLLPSYMIPSVYIRMDEPPLMVSGKLDRKKLRTMASSLKTEELLRYGETNGLSSPETPKQKKLQALWAEVLGVDIDLIRLESSFFRLSGDSVAAMRLVATARDVGVDITVQKIFQYPTLREQSAIVEFAQVATSELETVKRFDMLGDVNRIVESALATIREHDSQIDGDAILDIYPCSPLQEGVNIPYDPVL
jgi:amino acid adenylation domain-containing protein